MVLLLLSGLFVLGVLLVAVLWIDCVGCAFGCLWRFELLVDLFVVFGVYDLLIVVGLRGLVDVLYADLGL